MKKLIYIVPLVLLFCFTIACQDKAAMAELEKYKAQAKVEEQNKEVVRNFFAALDKNNFVVLKELLSDDFALQAPGLAELWGLDEIIQAVKVHYASFPDWKHGIEDMVAEGEKVAVRLVQNGTHTAPYEGILPTNKKVIMPTQCLFAVVAGKVKEFWVVENYLDFYQQLGMELKPKEAKKN
jgi:predicted ester cyclase